MTLPRGIALVRVETPLGKWVAVSDRLSEEEAKVARIVASERVRRGARAVVLGEIEVAAMLRDAA